MSDVQSEAAVESQQPAPVEGAPEVTGTPETVEQQPPVDNAHVAEGCEQFSSAAAAAHPADEHLEEIDAIASRWGGDVMTQVRALVAKIRAVL
jgi:hypothetical protein